MGADQAGKRDYMSATDASIEDALEAITATLNERELDDFDRAHVQQMVDQVVAGAQKLVVDDGGGVHDTSGRRIGAIRRTPSGEWITERQNPAAERSEAAIPSAPKQAGGLKRIAEKLTG